MRDLTIFNFRTLTAGVAALTQAAQAIDDLQNLNETTHKQKSDALFGAVNAKLTECLNAYNVCTPLRLSLA